MNSLAVMALLGATSATLGPLPGKTAAGAVWPLYKGTITPPTGAANVNNNQYLAAWTGNTMYKCFRSGYFAFPVQGLAPTYADASGGTATAANDRTTITGQTGTSRTFWALDYAMVNSANGQFNAVFLNNASIADIRAAVAKNSVQQCCPTANSNLAAYSVECNAGAAFNNHSSTPEAYGIVARVLLRSSTGSATTIGNANAETVSSTWNNDILLASMAHIADAAGTTTFTTTGGATDAYCSPFLNQVLAVGTEVAIQASWGLVAGTKCTWQIQSETKAVGPGMKITSASESDMLVQWMEFMKIGDLPANSALPATSVTTHWLGAYDAATGVFLNPQETKIGAQTDFEAVTVVWGQVSEDPSMNVPGEIGNALYYPDVDGPYKDTQSVTTSARELMNNYASLQSVYSSFDSDASAYNTLKTAYNDANKAEKDRDADFGKWLFEPVTKIPQRPCKPSQPPAWWGINLALGDAFGSGATTFALQKNTKNAYLQWTDTASPAVVSNLSDNKRAISYGYLVIGDDVSGTVTTTNVGKTFGILGEGKTALYENQAPFFWGEPATADLPTLMVSLLPDKQDTTGLTAADKKVEITAKAVTWATMDSTKPPTQPSGLADPDAEWNNASALGASILAASAVIATLA